MNSSKAVILTLFSFLLFIAINGCKKDNSTINNYPKIKTLKVNNISENGATFNAEIISTGNEEVIDHGFTWCDTANNKFFSESHQISLGTCNGVGKFDEMVERNLRPNFKYHIKSFLKTTNHYVVGEIVSFISLGSQAPIINDFEPKKVEWGDTITIHGKYFGSIADSNKIFFNNIQQTILNYNTTNNDSTLHVLIPSSIETSKAQIRIEQYGNSRTYTKDSLEIAIPSIADFYPKDATWGDTITITGNFPIYKRFNYKAYINYNETNIVKSTPSSIKIVLPSSLRDVSSIIKITVNQMILTTPSALKLKPPKINSFSPTQACMYEVIEIKGKYFKPNFTQIKMGEATISIDKIIGDSIIYAINNGSVLYPGNYTLAVIVAEQKSEASEQINYIRTTINEIKPYYVTFLDTLSIYGDFYIKNTGNSVLINGIEQKVVYASQNLFKVTVPTSIYYDNPNPSVRVKTYCGEGFVLDGFKIKTPVIHSISAYEGKKGDKLTIEGDFFNPELGKQSVSIGKVLSATRNKIEFEIGTITSDITKVSLFSWIHGEVLVTDHFKCISPFKKVAGVSRIGFGYSFKIGEFGYAGGGYYDYRIWKFDPKLNKWTPLINASSESIYGPACFVINNKGFIVGGSNFASVAPSDLNNEVRVFDPVQNTVSKKNNFPGLPRIGCFSFSIGPNGYLGGGQNGNSDLKDFWVYNSESDSWIQKEDFPGGLNKGQSAFVINQKAYVLNQNELWVYSQLEDKWERKADFPGDKRYLANAFSIGNKGYIANGAIYFGYYQTYPTVYYDDIWEYDSDKDTWSLKSPYPSYKCFGGASFVIDNKAYLGLGGAENGHGDIFNSNFFEYDPTQEP